MLIGSALSWALFVFSIAYCWADMAARVRSKSYRLLAAEMDATRVRWRFVSLLTWGVVGMVLTFTLLVE